MIISNDPFYNLIKNIISRGVNPLYVRNLENNIIYHISKAINVPINWDSPFFRKAKTPFNISKLNEYKKYMTIQWRKPWLKNRKNHQRIVGNGEEMLEKLDSNLFK